MPHVDDEARLAKLRSIPLFEHLDDDALGQILKCSAEFDAEPGHVLIQLDQPGSGLFVIEEGSVVVDLRDREIELGPGEFFGELALLRDDATHIARVKTATPVRCLAIGRDDFEALLHEQPEIAVAMLKTLAKRLAER